VCRAAFAKQKFLPNVPNAATVSVTRGNNMKNLVFVTVTALSLFASQSFAELAIGGYLGANQSQPTCDGFSCSGKQGSEIGALFLFPFFPTLSFRFSLAQKTRKTSFTVLNTDMTSEEKLNDFGLGIQWDLPVTDLYIMGGAKVSSSSSVSCDNAAFTCEKSKTDYPVFVGVGYNLVNLAVVHFAIEAEYEKGTQYLDSNSSVKSGGYAGRLIVKFGL
jgi:hypothetical protein